MLNSRFEIDITLNCSLSCNNCDRGCGVAPINKQLTIDDVNRFINEANRIEHKFEFVSVLGGEPTLHPHVIEICELLYNKLNFIGNRRVILKTNGYTEKTKNVLASVPPYITIENSSKSNSHPLFSKYNDAPIDYQEYENADFTIGCAIALGCGPSFYPEGKYYCCGAGASVDRIFNLGLGVDHISELTAEKLSEQKNMYCRYCGHFKDWAQSNTYTHNQINSKSWDYAINSYKQVNRNWV